MNDQMIAIYYLCDDYDKFIEKFNGR